MKKVKEYIKLFYEVKFYCLKRMVKKYALHDKSLDNIEWSISVWSGILDTLLLLVVFFMFFPLSSVQDNKHLLFIILAVFLVKSVVESIYWLIGHKWLEVVKNFENKPKRIRKKYLYKAKVLFWGLVFLLLVLATYRIMTAPDFTNG